MKIELGKEYIFNTKDVKYSDYNGMKICIEDLSTHFVGEPPLYRATFEHGDYPDVYENECAEKIIKFKLTENEFNMIIEKLRWMKCVVRDGNLNSENYCNGECDSECNRPDLCNFKNWLESKIVE